MAWLRPDMLSMSTLSTPVSLTISCIFKASWSGLMEPYGWQINLRISFSSYFLRSRPNPLAVLTNSSGSSLKDTTRHVCLFRMPLATKCRPSTVFPHPALPATIVADDLGRPPPIILSRHLIPVLMLPDGISAVMIRGTNLGKTVIPSPVILYVCSPMK